VGAAPAPSRRRGSNNFGRYLADKGFRILLWVWAALTLAVGVYALWLLAGVIPDEDFRIVSEIGWHIQCGSLLVLLVAVTLLAVFGVLVACAAFVVGYSEVRRSLRTLETSAGLLGFGIIALVIISVVCSDRCRPHATRVANLVCQETDIWGCTQKRRLGLGIDALSFEQGLDGGGPRTCSLVARLCQPPAGFNASTACVCSGNWDVAPAGTQAEPLGDTPWNGTIGGFCGAWGGGIAGEWCFVTPGTRCAEGRVTPLSNSKNVTVAASNGPCSASVDARSKCLPAGFENMLGALQVAGILGFSLVLLAIFAALLLRYPSKTTLQTTVTMVQPMPPGQALLQRFEDAQREAVRRLNDQTPEELKMMLYGFYKQAKEGDVKGDRPGYMAKRDDQMKYDYWARHRGMPSEDAIEGYVRTVAMLP